MRAAFFVDGFNLYHAMCDQFAHQKYKWLNLSQLAQNLMDVDEELKHVLYFTAYCDWDKQKEARHKTYVEALTKYGVRVVEGKFLPVQKRFKKRHMRIFDLVPYVIEDWLIPEEIGYVTNEEKRTDVNIGIRILDYAYKDYYDHAYIITADSDIAPAIELAKVRFPEKRFTVLLPIGHFGSKDLNEACNGSIRSISESDLAASLLPNPVMIGQKKVVCPYTWR